MTSAFGVGRYLRGTLGITLVVAACATSETPSPRSDFQGGTAGESGSPGQAGVQGGTSGSGPVAAGAGGTAGSPAGGASAAGAAGRGPSAGNSGAAGAASGGSAAGTAGRGGTGAGGATAGAAMGGEAGAGSSGDSGGTGESPSAGAGGAGACSGATACLVHRYSFGGSGTTVTDSIGAANGTVVNATLMSGGVTLSGGTSDQYVNLPRTLLSELTSATFELWVTWNGGSAWQRIFDFGDNNGSGPGNQGATGTTYLFLTPMAANSSGLLRVTYSHGGTAAEAQVNAAVALPASMMTHIAVVVDDAAETLELYLEGASVGRAAMTGTLADLNVENSWLGRSQFSADPEFGGTIHEFRIYAAARSAAQIQASRTAGPDTAPTN